MAKKKTPAKPAAKITRQVTPEADLTRLLKQCRSAKGQTDEIMSSLNQKIGAAVENKFLHKKAFSVTRSLDRMEPEQLAAFFDHFDHYCDVGGLRKRAEDAPSFDTAEAGEGETETRTGPRLVAGGEEGGDAARVG